MAAHGSWTEEFLSKPDVMGRMPETILHAGLLGEGILCGDMFHCVYVAAVDSVFGRRRYGGAVHCGCDGDVVLR